MNRNVVMAFVAIVVLGLVCVAVWQMWPRDTGTTVAPPPATAKKTVPQPQVDKNAAPPPAATKEVSKEALKEAIDKALKEAAKQPPREIAKEAPAGEDPFGGKPITVETLTGCKYTEQFQQGDLVTEFAPNGEWKVNGKVRAKWTIEGGRVKMYDDKGETHYLDIADNKLMLEGQEIKVTR